MTWPFGAQARMCLSYLEPENADPSQSEMCTSLSQKIIFLLSDDGLWNDGCEIC